MKLRMLGTGSAFSKVFYNTNALLTKNEQTLMIDCGNTAPRALYELGISLSEIDAVLISHIHADHIGGLEEFAFQMKFLHGRMPKLYIADVLVEPLWENALKGGLYQEEFPSLEHYFDVYPMKPGVIYEVLPDLKIKLIQTRHIPSKASFSLIINEGFYYSADAIFDQEMLLSLERDEQIKLFFHDCQLHPPGAVHACLSQLLTLPSSIQEKMYLMHYGDDQKEFIGRTGLMQFIEQHTHYLIDPLTFSIQSVKME
ncbi:MAG: MBL fold metallo-hydrolase [Candidatus Cohnella colombiensis]|uniref:MBL fold metallo-hydrolase n=1 Tax=Candidatus Cohnella colombiensis TaxID=3121368 RepID=A0AA95JBJ1_9BACL|nr:MAG: MBL fold metallo-hydrolase [Cohnella sp.]